MKKVLLFAAVAVIVGLVAWPVQATVNVQPGLNDAHLKDVSNFFRLNPTNGQYVALGVTDTPQVGDELRSVLRLDSLETVPGNGPYWLSQTTTGDEVTGLMYNLVIDRIDPNTGSIFFTSSARNPLVAANDKDGDITTWAAGTANPNNNAFGGVVELYQDPTPDINNQLNNPASTPSLWDTATQPVRPVTGTLADSYPSATDGTLWLSGVLLDLSQFGAGAPGEVYVLTPTGFGTFSGTGYFHVFDGLVESSIAGADLPMGGMGAKLADATIQVTIRLTTSQPDAWSNPTWQAGSSDPIEFDAVPEPTIMLLFGASIVGGIIRRRM